MPAKEFLKEYQLRITHSREEILNAFLEKQTALSPADIEKRISEQIDRVTIYRTINTFLEKGVIHKILDYQGGTKYALCKDSCTSENHDHNHVHFKCIRCKDTYCLENVNIPPINLPENFKVSEVNFLVQGTCVNCS